MGTRAGERTANILLNPKEKSQVKKQLFTASLFLCSSFLAMPVAAEPLCSDISLVAVYEPEKPEIQEEAGYAVVNLNIRKEPDKNSEVIGKYQKGEKVSIISDDGTWAKPIKVMYGADIYQKSINITCQSEAIRKMPHGM